MLKQKFQNDLNTAVKKNDEITRNTLRLLLAAILTKEKEKRYKISKEKPDIREEELVEKSNLADEEIIEIVSSEVKKRKEAISDYEKGEREDLVKKEKDEIEVLNKYLPEQLSSQEIEKIIKQAVEKVGAREIKDIGKVMAEIMPKVKGKADGSEVSKIVKELLS